MKKNYPLLLKTKTTVLVVLFSLLGFTIKAQIATQTIRGKIIDEASKTTLPGVNVVLVSDSSAIGAVTDVEGDFKLTNIPIGRHTLKITYIGYESQTIPNVVVTAGKEVILNLSLIEKITTMGEVEVVYDRSKDKTVTNNDMTTVSARSFNVDDTKKYAGALGDPSRMAANFAVVIAGNDSRNDIVVRGNSPNGMLWQLEGLNVYNPNHFGSFNSTGGPVSMLNNNNLDKSDFLTSAFPAQYGNATAGVFDLKLRDGNNQKSEFLAQMGFNGIEAGAEGPFSKKSKASYVVNYRYSTLGLFQAMGISFGTGNATPLYQDLNFKISVPTAKNNGKFTFFGIGGNSSIDLLGQDVDTVKADFYGDPKQNAYPRFKMGTIGASYQQNISTKTFFKFTLGATAQEQKYTTDSIAYGNTTQSTFLSQVAKFVNAKYSAVLNITHKFNAKNTLAIGGNSDYIMFNYYNKVVYKGVIDRVYVDINGNTNLSQAYAQFKHRFNTKLSANVGAHFQHFSLNNTMAVEPRAGVKLLLNSRSSINAGYGIHNQIQTIYNYYIQTPTIEGVTYTNKNMGFTQSQHFVLGYDNNLTDNIRLKLETYYQMLDKIPVNNYSSSFSALNDGTSFAPSDATNLVNKGTGTNYGVELTLERFFNKGFYFLITGSLFDSKYKGSDGIERNTGFNTKYASNILAGKEFKIGKKGNVLVFNLKMTSIGGKYLTPLNLEASKQSGKAVFDETKAFTEKQPDYFRVDTKIAFRKEYKKSTLEFAVDLQNVTNHQNVFLQGYNAKKNTISTQYQQGFFPVPMVKFTF
jgi:hypothetical protein